MNPYFNLIDEPWIPCLMPDNRLQEFGLLEVLVRAPEIREIFHSSPLVVTAVHRLLLAILHRNFGPENLAAWKELWERGSFDAQVLQQYFDRWRERFFLFHPERPFYQVPNMEGATEHPPQKLMQEASWGNNPTLFDHNFKKLSVPLHPKQAALYLLASQAFSFAGTAGKNFENFTDSPLARGLIVVPLGQNLFETLSLNLINYNQENPIPWINSDDPPCWEQDLKNYFNRGNKIINGYLDYLTLLSRKINLIFDENKIIIKCQIIQGLKLSDNFTKEVFMAYKQVQEQGLIPLRLEPERAIWRDSHALLCELHKINLKKKKLMTRRPEIFNWIARIKNDLGSRDYQFDVMGMASNKAKVELWRFERLPLPLAYLDDKDLLGELRLALEKCERAHDLLLSHTKKLAALVLAPPVAGQRRQADPKEVARLVQSWAPSRRYWARLEAPFRHLMIELPADQTENEDGEVVYGTRLLPEWRRTVYQAARQGFQEVAKGLENSLRSLKALAQVEGPFLAALKKELLPEE